jgi:hypothetical protein
VTEFRGGETAVLSSHTKALGNDFGRLRWGALKSDDVIRQMQLQGMEPLGGTPEDFVLRIKEDTARWGAVLKASGLEK